MLEAIKNFAKESEYPVVAFLCRPKYFIDLIYIAEGILERREKLVPVLLNYGNCDIGKTNYDIPQFEIAQENLESLDDIKIFVCKDTMWPGPNFSCPHTSTVLATLHTFPHKKKLEELGYMCGNFEFNDIAFIPHTFASKCTGKQYEKAWGNKIPPPAHPRNKKYTVVPCGYPKIDLIGKNIRLHNNRQDSVLIAPHLCNPPYSAAYNDIIVTALESCPDYSVIFRPQPREKENSVIKDIQKSYADNHRVIFDFKSSNVDSLSRAKVHITDVSQGKMTFSLASGRPHITYRPDLYTGQEMTFEGLGFSTFNTEQLAKAIKLCVKSKALPKEVLANRDKELFNSGGSVDIIVDTILACLKNEKRDNWIEFDRTYLSGAWDSPGFWANFLLTHKTVSYLTPNYGQLYDLARRRWPGHSYFNFPSNLSRFFLSIDYDKKEFRLLTEDEISKLSQNPADRPPYAAWIQSFQGLTSAQVEDYLCHPRCIFLTTPNANEYGQTVLNKKILNNAAIFEYKLELLAFFGNLRVFLPMQLYFANNGFTSKVDCSPPV